MVKIVIQKKIKDFKKIIKVDSDKSLSIRFVLLASQAIGKSSAYNLLKSEGQKQDLFDKFHFWIL